MPFRPVAFPYSLSYKGFVPGRRPKLSHHRAGIDQSSRVFAQVLSMSTPRPFSWPLHHAGSDRIEMNITHQLQKIALAVADDRFVAPLKQMPLVSVGPVKPPYVAG
jgi:hypothetical protein